MRVSQEERTLTQIVNRYLVKAENGKIGVRESGLMIQQTEGGLEREGSRW